MGPLLLATAPLRCASEGRKNGGHVINGFSPTAHRTSCVIQIADKALWRSWEFCRIEVILILEMLSNDAKRANQRVL